ncbi:hypothetical protein [Lysobacter xanthus]
MSLQPLDVVFRLARSDLSLASVRYRGLAPAIALRDRGRRVGLSTAGGGGGPEARIGVAVKPLTQADADWAARRRDRAEPVVVDLCDNVFVDGYGGDGGRASRRIRALLPGCHVTVPTHALQDVVVRECSVPADTVSVVPDIVETPALLAREAALVGARSFHRGDFGRLGSWLARMRRMRLGRGAVLLWFGNAGAPWAASGLSDLLLLEDALRDTARRHRVELWIVSNDAARYREIRPRLPVPTRYFEWSPARLDALLPAADICLVPNSLDPFSRTKSANRAVKALAAAVPVVATPTAACRALEGAIWLDDPAAGIDRYLQDPPLVRQHLQVGRALIARDYSMSALGAAMAAVVRGALEAA